MTMPIPYRTLSYFMLQSQFKKKVMSNVKTPLILFSIIYYLQNNIYYCQIGLALSPIFGSSNGIKDGFIFSTSSSLPQ